MDRGNTGIARKSLIRQLASDGRKAFRNVKNRILNQIDAPVIVLIYHRVTELDNDPEQLAVTPQNFRAQMLYLKEYFNLARFEDDWAALNKPTVVVTFDDGYADNVLEALPILEEIGVPATFFISSGYIDTRNEFWWDDLSRIICQKNQLPDKLEISIKNIDHYWSTTTLDERWQCYLDLHRIIKKQDVCERDELFLCLRGWSNMDAYSRETHRIASLSELKTLASSPLVTIGAHTVNHAALSSLTVIRQEEEIFRSKEELEKLIGKKIEVFSYPFGSRNDYTVDSRRICQKAGFIKTAANFPGNSHRWTDPHQMPRHLVRNWPVEQFAMHMMKFKLL